MKKKPFDIDKIHDKKLNNNEYLEINQELDKNTDHIFDQDLSYKMDKESDKVIENALKSAFAEEEKNLHLTEKFKSSLITQMKQMADEDSANRTATDDADTEGKNIKPAASSSGVIHSIHHFLNREIEIPLVPVLAASLLLIAINVMPLNYEPRPEGRIIEVGGSQLWIPYNGEGEDVAHEN